jgi:hypothetical protein
VKSRVVAKGDLGTSYGLCHLCTYRLCAAVGRQADRLWAARRGGGARHQQRDAVCVRILIVPTSSSLRHRQLLHLAQLVPCHQQYPPISNWGSCPECRRNLPDAAAALLMAPCRIMTVTCWRLIQLNVCSCCVVVQPSCGRKAHARGLSAACTHSPYRQARSADA